MLKLRYKSVTTVPVEVEAITPDNLADKTPKEIAQISIQHGTEVAPLGDFYVVEGDASDREIEIEGDCSRVKWIGAGMKSGRIVVRGNVGMHLGSEMTGGEIEVHGCAGDWVGAEMRGGHIHVYGDAGHLIGSAYRGAHVGMRGGEILIDGKAGNEIGGHLRRGLIAVAGDAGDFIGVGMIAGSIVIGGEPGQRIGAGMKRGTIVMLTKEPRMLPTFRYDCDYRPSFLSIYLSQLRAWGFPMPGNLPSKWRRFSGDLVELGLGEIFTPLAESDR